MRFYEACVAVAKSVGALMNDKQMETFIATNIGRLCDYQVSIGMWIRNHLLPHNTYLSEALTLLGYTTPEKQSLFLIEFAHRYWRLHHADMW